MAAGGGIQEELFRPGLYGAERPATSFSAAGTTPPVRAVSPPTAGAAVDGGQFVSDGAWPKGKASGFGPEYAGSSPAAPANVSEECRREAHREIEGAARALRERVYLAILGAAAKGRTALEIEAQLGIPGSTVRPRIVELRKAGRIAESGEERKTPSGRNAAVWVAR